MRRPRTTRLAQILASLWLVGGCGSLLGFDDVEFKEGDASVGGKDGGIGGKDGGIGGGVGGAQGGSGGAQGGSGGLVTGGSGGLVTGGAAGSGGVITGGAAGAGGAAGSGGTGGASGGTGGASGGTGGATGGAGGASGGTGGSAGTTGLNCTAAVGSPPSLKLTEVAGGFNQPLIAVSPSGDSRLFVGEQAGTIRIMKGATKVATPFLDISARVQAGGEQGLLGLAFHPSYASNRRFYVHYTGDGTTAPSGDTVISEFLASSTNPDVAEPTSEKILLTVDQPESNHNGGALHFRNDGMLYIGLGDGGGAGDQHGTIGNGQSLATLLGKILRIDVNTPAGGKNYGIPTGNMTGAGVLPEIWSYGLRNPWRWAFDGCTWDQYIGDVGQNQREEVDVEPAAKGSGTNWGWRVMEGTICFNPASGCNTAGKELPVVDYSHSLGCSITGGYVYRGSAIPGLRGIYIYADFCSGRFWWFRYSGGTAQNQAEITSTINPGAALKSISSFGQDAAGELYVTRFNGADGKLYRIDSQ